MRVVPVISLYLLLIVLVYIRHHYKQKVVEEKTYKVVSATAIGTIPKMRKRSFGYCLDYLYVIDGVDYYWVDYSTCYDTNKQAIRHIAENIDIVIRRDDKSVVENVDPCDISEDVKCIDYVKVYNILIAFTFGVIVFALGLLAL